MNEAVSYLAVPLSLDIFAAERFGIAVEYCRIRLERKPLPLSLAVAHFDSLSLSSLLSLSLFNQFFFSFSFWKVEKQEKKCKKAGKWCRTWSYEGEASIINGNDWERQKHRSLHPLLPASQEYYVIETKHWVAACLSVFEAKRTYVQCLQRFFVFWIFFCARGDKKKVYASSASAGCVS